MENEISTNSPQIEHHDKNTGVIKTSLTASEIPVYRKIFLIFNELSGERTATAHLCEEFQQIVGASNIHRLNFSSPKWEEEAIWFIRSRFSPDVDNVLIVVGGDGTVALACELILKSGVNDEQFLPPPGSTNNLVNANSANHNCGKLFISVIPIGTGNDLSRSLGFGAGFRYRNLCCQGRNIKYLLQKYVSANKGQLDMWDINFKHILSSQTSKIFSNYNNSTDAVHSANPIELKTSSVENHTDAPVPTSDILFHKSMINYFSIGFEAQVLSHFETFRSAHPAICSSRTANKVVYASYGLKMLFSGTPYIKSDSFYLEVDGKHVPLPSGLKSVVVCNVATYSSGVKIWKTPKKKKVYYDADGNKLSYHYKDVEINDGTLEVVGIYGPIHMLFMQARLRHGAKLAEGSNVRIVHKNPLLMHQVDGEFLREGQDICKRNGAIEINFSLKERIRTLHVNNRYMHKEEY